MSTPHPPPFAAGGGSERHHGENVVAYREENGVFTSRAQIEKVPKLG